MRKTYHHRKQNVLVFIYFWERTLAQAQKAEVSLHSLTASFLWLTLRASAFSYSATLQAQGNSTFQSMN
jgi:hypothetical protein